MPDAAGPSPLVFLTGGDPAGIAPEVVEKALHDVALNRPLIYLHSAGAVDARRLCSRSDLRGRMLPADPDALAAELRRIADTNDVGLWLIDVSSRSGLPGCEADVSVRPGQPGVESGLLAFRALHIACDLIQQHGCRALVTAPLSKEWVARSGQGGFSGHTGYLADFFRSRVVMLMHGEHFSVIPLTEHLPLRSVSGALREMLTGSASSDGLVDLLARLATAVPFRGRSVALCGLNPHSGEGGLIGGEEEEFLIPFVARLRERGVSIDGPLPADTLFMPGIRQKYRLMLSCYHDQGLIPFKALEGERGINVTIGLPFLRTSPDHGTAYGIAGQGRADATSMRRALEAGLHATLDPALDASLGAAPDSGSNAVPGAQVGGRV